MNTARTTRVIMITKLIYATYSVNISATISFTLPRVCRFIFPFFKLIIYKFIINNQTYIKTDGNDDSFLRCGVIPGVYPTIDFGPDANVTQSFMAQRRFASKGPLVNSEYYDGWLDLWGSPHSRVTTQNILYTFEEMMNVGVNVNFYMFHGGTNFGFSNGC